MSTTPRLGFTEMASGEQSGYVTFNALAKILDAYTQGSIKSRSTVAEPGSPSEGDCYLVPTSATGTNWSGHDGELAQYFDAAWMFYTVGAWFDAYVEDEGISIMSTKQAYVTLSVAGSSNVVLTTDEAAAPLIEFTGALTGNITVTWPDAARVVAVFNNTSGAFTLTPIPASGTGAAVTQGNREFVGFDGAGVASIWS